MELLQLGMKVFLVVMIITSVTIITGCVLYNKFINEDGDDEEVDSWD